MSDKNLSSLLIRAATKITKRIFEAKRKQFYLTRLVQYWVELWGELWVDVVRFFPREENAFQRKRTKYLPPFETAAILLVFRLLTWRATCVTQRDAWLCFWVAVGKGGSGGGWMIWWTNDFFFFNPFIHLGVCACMIFFLPPTLCKNFLCHCCVEKVAFPLYIKLFTTNNDLWNNLWTSI